ncbi:uncharacterized protein CLUP02_15587 [Colletotrichum lupini]|uniref:Uncharacterized protein n=1 Tax=Colletotrichum lupini TaxID=145971 RepID=A0A9Q8T8L4_9PEZI|nr:uncharacterized protein CLUP02_15587 [Colletotrichum lupini]UQC90056.1 hypothetical protein CLUP02_15587 [Colletotrichum lupini]
MQPKGAIRVHFDRSLKDLDARPRWAYVPTSWSIKHSLHVTENTHDKCCHLQEKVVDYLSSIAVDTYSRELYCLKLEECQILPNLHLSQKSPPPTAIKSIDPAQTSGNPEAINASDTVSLAVNRKHPLVTITSLPDEVHHLVASNLCEHCTGCLTNPDQPSHTNSAELFNLYLVDTHWRDIATPYLYHVWVLRQTNFLSEKSNLRQWKSQTGGRNRHKVAGHGLLRGTAMWHQWLMLQTPALDTVSVYHQHQLHFHEYPDIEKLAFIGTQRNMDIPTMLMFDSPSYVPRQVYPHTTGCYGRYGPYGWPFDDSRSLRDLAIERMFIRCGGMEGIQYISHGHMDWVACQNLNDSCVSYTMVMTWYDRFHLPRDAYLFGFRALHIIAETNAVEMSPEELVIRRQLEDLGVELKFYEQDILHGVDYAVLEDEGWTVNDKIGGSLDFQFSSKETSS